MWAQFDSAGPKIGREWPIRYRGDDEERVAQLRSFGVRRFPTLPYAHKPGVAAYLNEWARGFAAEVPESLWSAAFFPEPEAPAYVGELVAAGVEVFKVHLQVGEFHLDDPLLDEVWGVLSDARTPVVVHAGSGPVGNDFTGPASMARLLARFPGLVLIVAHLGSPESQAFLDLATEYDGVYLDTTMVFTDFWPIPSRATAAAGRCGTANPARHRLPQHPVPLRAPARGPGPPRPRRRLAAGGLLGKQHSTVQGPQYSLIGA